MMRVRTSPPLALVATAFALGSCTGDGGETRDSALQQAAAAMTSIRDSVTARIDDRNYSNAQLLALLNAYNDAEIEVGELAQGKGTDTAARNFARQIVTEHRALKANVTRTGQQLNLTLTMPADDRNLASDHRSGMQDLEARTKGRDFDEAFARHEIAMHQKMLEDLDATLASTRNPEIRPLLEQARTTLRAHLRRAEQIASRLGTG